MAEGTSAKINPHQRLTPHFRFARIAPNPRRPANIGGAAYQPAACAISEARMGLSKAVIEIMGVILLYAIVPFFSLREPYRSPPARVLCLFVVCVIAMLKLQPIVKYAFFYGLAPNTIIKLRNGKTDGQKKSEVLGIFK